MSSAAGCCSTWSMPPARIRSRRWRVVRGELDAYGAGLADKPEIVALSRSDLVEDKQLAKVRKALESRQRRRVLPISAPPARASRRLLDAIVERLGTRRTARPKRLADERPLVAAVKTGDYRRDRLRRRAPARRGDCRGPRGPRPDPARRRPTAPAIDMGQRRARPSRTALDELVDGADAVIHVAGVINAPDRGGFRGRQRRRHAAMLAAADAAGGAAASSMSRRWPRASRNCRSTARPRRGRRRWSTASRLDCARSSARRRSMVPATRRRSNCSRWPGWAWSCCRPRAGCR